MEISTGKMVKAAMENQFKALDTFAESMRTLFLSGNGISYADCGTFFLSGNGISYADCGTFFLLGNGISYADCKIAPQLYGPIICTVLVCLSCFESPTFIPLYGIKVGDSKQDRQTSTVHIIGPKQLKHWISNLFNTKANNIYFRIP